MVNFRPTKRFVPNEPLLLISSTQPIPAIVELSACPPPPPDLTCKPSEGSPTLPR